MVMELLTNQKTVFDSIGAAALALNIRQSSISTYFIDNRTKPSIFSEHPAKKNEDIFLEQKVN